MGASYKCNWCGKKLTAHSCVRSIKFEMPENASHRNIAKYIKVSVTISVPNGYKQDFDICDSCIKKAKDRAAKELMKIKL